MATKLAELKVPPHIRDLLLDHARQGTSAVGHGTEHPLTLNYELD